MSGIQFRAVMLLAVIVAVSTQLSAFPRKSLLHITYQEDQRDLQVFVAVIIADALVDRDDDKNLEWARSFLAQKNNQRWRYTRKVQYLGHTAFAFQLESGQEMLAMD